MILFYRDYQKSRDLSWEVLLREKVDRLPVKVGAVCRQMGIRVAYYDSVDGNDGKSVIIDGQPWIFIANGKPVRRQRFTCAHELGHILLGHVGRYDLVNREPDPKDNPIEHSANVFAARLLAPACVLWALNARTPEQIARLCDISHQSATFRAERMELLYRRKKFLASQLEQQVYEQFRDFIQDQRSSEASGI